MIKYSFDYVTKQATDTRGFTNIQKVWFHLWNPNGLTAAWWKSNDAINKAVEEGKLKSGAILAYGSFNDYYYNRLNELNQKKRVNTIELAVVIQGLQKDIKKAEEVLAKL